MLGRVVGGCAIWAASIGFAGTPVEETLTCPIGEETFAIVGTASCSILGRYMSFRPQTTCEFVTRLPVCPSNDFPMYQPFSPDQITALTVFVETDEYQEIRQLSLWLRAYAIAQHMGQSGDPVTFSLMLNALWFTTEDVISNDAQMDVFMAEAEQEMARAVGPDRGFLAAIIGFALLSADREAQAAPYLETAASHREASEYLDAYLTAIDACRADMSAPNCAMSAPFNP
ncbi:hypothetical protein [Aestuariibius sp. HNIBRBA575]|uniref:hypothetical protein n=1 Tax=Aestuariibius sp. HNIBRBA575 TaxID=3233343 RepID=UPI0034A4A040